MHDDKALRREAERQGWEIEHGRNHDKWRCPTCRGIVVAATTASDGRARLNHLAHLRQHGFSWRGRPGVHRAT